MSLKIYRLSERPQWAETCHAWDEAEWPRTPEIAAVFASHYEEAARNRGSELPQTFVAALDDGAVGMVSLVQGDHPKFTQIGPWMASGFVLPKQRMTKVTPFLYRAALDFARDTAKIEKLFVYTRLPAMRRGWKKFQETYDPFTPSKKVTIYRYDFTTTPN